MSEDDRSGNRPVIALDGLSGSGKSTLARRLAAELGWAYLDSGAWYRALSWACVQSGTDVRSSAAVLGTLSSIEIHGHPDGTVVVDGRPLHGELRNHQIDAAVAEVADHTEVREGLVDHMRRLMSHPPVPGVVADGRDAATVIFPGAELKIFVDASVESRAKRRHGQRTAAGLDVSYEEVLAQLKERDARDGSRGPYAPHPAPDGLILENNDLSVEEAVERLLDLAAPLRGAFEGGSPEPAGEAAK